MSTMWTERTSQVLSIVPCELALHKSVEDLLKDYKSAEPFPHHVLDNLFPAKMLDALLDELPPASSEKWVHERHDQFVKSNLRSAADLGPESYQFLSMLHSAAFLYFLYEITGVRALLPDPYLSGGGYHVVPEGGKFDVHADRNTDHNSGLERRLAMLIYLNKDWDPENGGQLELWNQEGSKCEKVIQPTFNKTVIFEIGDKNFHGVRPVIGGKGISRKSFALYFHTVGKDLVFHNSIYAPKIYQDKVPLASRIAREVLPPFLYRPLKNRANRKK
jgi:hypothetical protein